MHRALIFLATVLSLPHVISGQEVCYENYPLAPVINILDVGDEIWMTTRGDGVFRFDKDLNTTEQFTSGEAGLSSNYCLDLISYNGQLLISTDSLVYSVSDNQFEVYLDDIGGAMAISSAGRLIVSSGERYTEWENGILHYEKDFFELNSDGLNLSCVICDMSSDIAIDNDGVVWISHFGFYEFDILRFDGDNWTVYDHATEGNQVLPIESFNFSNQILYHDGSVWATSWMGLSRRTDDQWSLFHNPLLASGVFNAVDTMATYPMAMTVDSQEQLWVGSVADTWNSVNSELALLDEDGWHIYTGLPDYIGFQCLEASSTDPDILYAGTSVGLSIIDKTCLTSSVQTFDAPSFNLHIDLDQETLTLSDYELSLTTRYHIYNSNGIQISSGDLRGTSEQIRLADMANGHYTISVFNEESRSSRSFIKIY